MSLIIPTTVEKLRTAAEIFNDTVHKEDLTIDDPRLDAVAAEAVRTCLPGYQDLVGKRVELEAFSGIAVISTHPHSFGGVAVQASFSAIRIEQPFSEADELQLDTIGLYAELHPTYLHATPSEIDAGDRILAPLEGLETFDLVESY